LGNNKKKTKIMTILESTFIDLFAEEGKELWNGEVATNRVSMPLGTDYSVWIERDIVIEIVDNDSLQN
jgi:hypothetical protein